MSSELIDAVRLTVEHRSEVHVQDRLAEGEPIAAPRVPS
jgi:hypothetical protein